MSQVLPAGSDVSQIDTTYDANGNVETITETQATGTEVTRHRYDPFNRLVQQSQRGHVMDYAYDANGNRTQVSSPGGTSQYSYDSRNRLNTVVAGSTTQYHYGVNNWLQQVVQGNGTRVDYDYDAAGRVTRIDNRLADGQLLSRFAYTYDANGNRTQQVELQNGLPTAPSLTTDYRYDALDRLVGFSETGPGHVTEHRFTYYPSYDRKTEVVVHNGVTLKNRSYDYNGSFELTQVTETAGGSITYQYDANGNRIHSIDTTGGRNHSTRFEYNSRNQLTRVAQGAPGAEVGQGSYAYNYAGMRTRHLGSERGDIEYLYDGDSIIDELHNNSTSLVAHYRYGDRLLSLTSGGSDQFYHYASLGTTANLTNAAGEAQIAYRTDPFGQITQQEGTSVNRHVFTGQEHDEQTGLIYFGARFYDPDVAGFINQDSYLGESTTPPSLHRYLYAYSNPTVYVDENGHFVGTIIGGISGAAWGIGQTIGAGINDTYNHFAYGSEFRSAGQYASIAAQNAIAGVEMGASFDVTVMSGGTLALAGSGALGGAGFDAMTFDGSAQSWGDFGQGQVDGAVSGAVGGVVIGKAMPLLGKAGEWAASKSVTVNAVAESVGAKASSLGGSLAKSTVVQETKALAAKIEGAASLTKEKVSGLLKPSQAANVSDSAVTLEIHKYNTTPMRDIFESENIPGFNRWWTGKSNSKAVRHLNDKEISDATIGINADGLLAGGGGVVYSTANSIVIKDGIEHEVNSAIFIMREDGELVASKYQSVGEFHHSSLNRGRPVSGAGEITIENGVCTKITCRSGHYKPTEEINRQVLEQLKKMGVDIDNIIFVSQPKY